jgi:hypothetical protein
MPHSIAWQQSIHWNRLSLDSLEQSSPVKQQNSSDGQMPQEIPQALGLPQALPSQSGVQQELTPLSWLKAHPASPMARQSVAFQ